MNILFKSFLILILLQLSLLKLVFSQTNKIIFKKFSGASNSYVIAQAKEAVLIDAGAKADPIIEYIKKENLTIKYIILTHGHDDHFNELPKLKAAYPHAKIVIHKNDNGSLRLIKIKLADLLLQGNETLHAGNLKLEIIHTPGHTGGCICIKVGNKIFTGDTLFKETIGSTSSWSSNFEDLIKSIKTKLMTLNDSLLIYPGHGESSTIGHERKHNSFLK